jgi:hypothetical protein
MTSNPTTPAPPSLARPSVDLLSFACPSLTYPGNLSPELVESGSVRLPDYGDTGLNHWLMGQSFFGEAFASEAARNAKLGPVHTYISFVPTTWALVEDGGATPADIAIGPALGKDGFEEVADLVIPAKVERMLEFAFGGGESHVSIIIDRVDYTVRRDDTGALSVMASPLYRAWNGEPAIDATAKWLLQAFADQLSSPPTPPKTPLSDFRRVA